MEPRFSPATILLTGVAVSLVVYGTRRWQAGALDTRPRLQVALAALSMLLVVSAVFAEALRGWALAPAALALDSWPWAAYSFGTLPARPNVMQIDIAYQFHPWLHYVRNELLSGHLPLWNPLGGTGEPFLALSQPAVLSPLTWAAVLAPLPHALVVLGALQLFLGGLGMYVLLRAFGLGWPAALIGGLGWLLNSFSVGWLCYPFASVATWAPWLVWSVVTAARPQAPRAVARVAITGALTLVAGQPEIAFKVWLLAGGVALALLLAIRAQTRGLKPARYLLGLGAGAALAVALAAPQVLPLLEHLPETAKFAHRRSLRVNDTYTPRKAIVTAVVPDFFGRPKGPWAHVTNRHGAPTNYLEQAIFPGVTIWILAAVGLVAARRHWPVRALGLLALASALLKYGAPGVLLLASRLPLFRITVLGRFNLIVLFSVVALAAWGVEALLNGRRTTHNAETSNPGERDAPVARVEGRAWPAIAAAAAMALLVGASLVRERDLLHAATIWSATLVASALALSVAAIVSLAVVARVRHLLAGTAIIAILVVSLAGELVGFARAYHPLAPPTFLYPEVPELETMRRDTSLFRVAGIGPSVLPNAPMAFGLAGLGTYDGLDGDARLNVLLRAALGLDLRRPLDTFINPDALERNAVLDLLNVKYLVAPPDARLPADHFQRVASGRGLLFRNRRVFPRAFLVDRYQVLDWQAAASRLAAGQIDLQRTVMLTQEPRPSDQPSPGASSVDRARVVHYRDNYVEVATECAAPRLLVLTDLYSTDWQPSVDGRRVALYLANVAFRAVAVPAGAHTVRFEYRPRAFRLGVVLSSAAGAIVLILWALCYLRRPT